MNKYKLLVLGSGGAGKTALVTMLVTHKFAIHHNPTIEDSYQKQMIVGDEMCRLDILDTGDDQEYATFQEQAIRKCEAFLIVYDKSSRSSFAKVQTCYDQITRIKESPPPPIMLVGNKYDEPNQQITSTEGKALAKMLGCQYIETSAKKHHKVEEAFSSLVRKLQQMAQSKVGQTAQTDEKRFQTQHILTGVWGLFAQYARLCGGQRRK